MADMTERKRAEQAYIELAHDYAANPIGSRDWVIFWNGWRERSELTATPQPADAALVGKLRHQLAQVTDECARLRALSQPAVPPALVTAALGTGGGEKLFVPVHIAVEAAHIAARGQHAAAIEYAHRYAQPAAPVAQVPEGFVLVDISLIDDEWMQAAMRDAGIVRNIGAPPETIMRAAISGYLLAASQSAAPSAKGDKQ